MWTYVEVYEIREFHAGMAKMSVKANSLSLPKILVK
jgi:hypothetical protein